MRDNSWRRWGTLVALAAVALCAAGMREARASIVLAYTGQTTAGAPAGTVYYNYTMTFNTNAGTEQLFAYPGANDVFGNPIGGFATVYDWQFGTAPQTIGGAGSGVVVPTGWTAVIANTGQTPPGTTPFPPADNAAIPNITFRYTDGTLTTDTAWTIQIASSLTTTTLGGSQTGNDAKQDIATGALVQAGNVTRLTIPTTAVPEPSTAFAAGTGLLLALGAWLRRRG